MNTHHCDPEEEVSPMILIIDEGIKLEDMEHGTTEQGEEQWSDSDPRWTDETIPPTTTLGSEIEEV